MIVWRLSKSWSSHCFVYHIYKNEKLSNRESFESCHCSKRLYYIMPYRDQRICPICGRERVSNISSHFSQVHGLESSARKSWLKLTKYQTMNTVYKHLSSLTREQTNHSSPVKRPCMTMRTMKKQKRATNTRKVNEFLYSKMLYPNFKFQHPTTILVVRPTN